MRLSPAELRQVGAPLAQGALWATGITGLAFLIRLDWPPAYPTLPVLVWCSLFGLGTLPGLLELWGAERRVDALIVGGLAVAVVALLLLFAEPVIELFTGPIIATQPGLA